MSRPRARLRELDIAIGRLPPGPMNAITDVAGVRVGHCTVIEDAPKVARTGVTVVMPEADSVPRHHVFAGFHAFNGFGEMAGAHWIAEGGLLTTPVVLTSTY